MTRERADKVLVDRGLVSSRGQAKSLIEMGQVLLGDRPVKKAGELIDPAAELSVQVPTYVGRGAFKLLGAIEAFSPLIAEQILMDVGASTGGFTEVLLDHGAKQVFAIDVGHGQLAAKLVNDPRVVNMEGHHVLQTELPIKVAGGVVDLSFISVTKVFSKLSTFLVKDGWLIVLIKPQFEVGKELLPKDGVVKEEQDRLLAIGQVLQSAKSFGFEVTALIDCPVEGKTGNLEALAYLKLKG